MEMSIGTLYIFLLLPRVISLKNIVQFYDTFENNLRISIDLNYIWKRIAGKYFNNIPPANIFSDYIFFRGYHQLRIAFLG